MRKQKKGGRVKLLGRMRYRDGLIAGTSFKLETNVQLLSIDSE